MPTPVTQLPALFALAPLLAALGITAGCTRAPKVTYEYEPPVTITSTADDPPATTTTIPAPRANPWGGPEPWKR